LKPSLARPRKPPGYQEARKALAQHLWRHHGQATGSGELHERIEQHAELHLLCKRNGLPVGHTHEPYPEGETDIETAHRLYQDGESQHG